MEILSADRTQPVCSSSLLTCYSSTRVRLIRLGASGVRAVRGEWCANKKQASVRRNHKSVASEDLASSDEVDRDREGGGASKHSQAAPAAAVSLF